MEGLELRIHQAFIEGWAAVSAVFKDDVEMTLGEECEIAVKAAFEEIQKTHVVVEKSEYADLLKCRDFIEKVL